MKTRLLADLARGTLDTSIDVPLPSDYLKLVTDRELEINGWQIMDLSESLYEVVEPDHNYYVLARKPEVGQIGIRSTDQSGALVFMNMDTDENEPIHSSFLSFVQSYVHQET